MKLAFAVSLLALILVNYLWHEAAVCSMTAGLVVSGVVDHVWHSSLHTFGQLLLELVWNFAVANGVGHVG